MSSISDPRENFVSDGHFVDELGVVSALVESAGNAGATWGPNLVAGRVAADTASRVNCATTSSGNVTGRIKGAIDVAGWIDELDVIHETPPSVGNTRAGYGSMALADPMSLDVLGVAHRNLPGLPVTDSGMGPSLSVFHVSQAEPVIGASGRIVVRTGHGGAASNRDELGIYGRDQCLYPCWDEVSWGMP